MLDSNASWPIGGLVPSYLQESASIGRAGDTYLCVSVVSGPVLAYGCELNEMVRTPVNDANEK